MPDLHACLANGFFNALTVLGDFTQNFPCCFRVKKIQLNEIQEINFLKFLPSCYIYKWRVQGEFGGENEQKLITKKRQLWAEQKKVF